MELKICGIYCIENLINGKKYIGKSTNIHRRFIDHRYHLTKKEYSRRKCNPHLWKSVRKYGIENFKFYVLENLGIGLLQNDLNLAAREEYWIEHFKSYDKASGYNIVRVSAITILTQEHRDKISAALKGRKRTPEQRLRMKITAKGNCGMVGRVVRYNTKVLVSLINSKYSYACYLEGELLRLYASAFFLESNGFRWSGVNKCCIGERKHYKSFSWRKIPFVGLDVVEKFGGVIDPKDWRYAEPIDTPTSESV